MYNLFCTGRHTHNQANRHRLRVRTLGMTSRAEPVPPQAFIENHGLQQVLDLPQQLVFIEEAVNGVLGVDLECQDALVELQALGSGIADVAQVQAQDRCPHHPHGKVVLAGQLGHQVEEPVEGTADEPVEALFAQPLKRRFLDVEGNRRAVVSRANIFARIGGVFVDNLVNESFFAQSHGFKK